MRFRGKVALITASGRGIGRATAEIIGREGGTVVGVEVDKDAPDHVVSAVRAAGGTAHGLVADALDAAQVAGAVKRVVDEHGRIDILVNAAGITGPIETPVWEIKADDFDQVIAVNLRGTFLPTKHVLPGMIKQRYGKIVNISGTSGLRGYKYRAAYSSSKWALRGFTRTVALEAGPYNINVNALHPGIVGGDRMDKLCREKAKKRGWTPEQVYQEYVDEMALKRVTVAQDIANAVLFLVSDDSSNMTGQSVTVDGGWDV